MLSPIEKANAKAEALQTLGLHQYATQSDVRTAWHNVARKMHPDCAPGRNAEFANAKIAYEFLNDPKSGVVLASEPKPKPVYAKRIRLQLESRTSDMSKDAVLACRAVLGQQVQREDTDSSNGAPHHAATGNETKDHVPSSFRRRGRRMSYLVDSPLAEGMNRVAIPTGELVNRREILPKVMSFSSPKSGRGSVEVPAEMLAELFPGAQSVRIHFQNCGTRDAENL